MEGQIDRGERMSQVVVVGAGMGGLAVAPAAGRGHQVTVLEQSADIGGKLGGIERDGFAFDTGPSLLTLPHVLATCSSRPAPVHDVLSLQRFRRPPDTGSPTAPRWTAVLTRRDPGAWRRCWVPVAARLAALLARAESIWDVTREPFLESPLAVRRLLGGFRAGRTCDDRPVADVAGPRPAVVRDPRLFSRPLRHLHRVRPAPGARCARGGAVRRAGVRRLVRAPAACTGWPRRWRERARTRRPIDVISAAAAAHHGGGAVDRGASRGRRPPGRRRSWWSRTPTPRSCPRPRPGGRTGRAAARPARHVRRCPASCCCSRCDGRTPGLQHHTVLFPADYDAEFDAVFGSRGRRSRCRDPTVYVCAPDDPVLAPDRHESWFVLVNAPRQCRATPGRGWTGPLRASWTPTPTVCWQVLADRGLDVRDRVRLREVRTPADLARRTGSPGGSIYGSSSNGARAGVPAAGQPLAGTAACTWSAARPTPAAGCPLVAMSAESSPT